MLPRHCEEEQKHLASACVVTVSEADNGWKNTKFYSQGSEEGCGCGFVDLCYCYGKLLNVRWLLQAHLYPMTSEFVHMLSAVTRVVVTAADSRGEQELSLGNCRLSFNIWLNDQDNPGRQMECEQHS